MYLPSDDNILLSLVNTLLRDKYGSLEDLCAAEDVGEELLTARLTAAGYNYDEATNAFRPVRP